MNGRLLGGVDTTICARPLYDSDLSVRSHDRFQSVIVNTEHPTPAFYDVLCIYTNEIYEY